ncbi:ABC transporter ATP-binding protein [Candidatus Pacearchaeota archaeon]|nr:ABC transporter ATP-binding protein [Candidatus Pacearchaeota archaeon]
METMNVIEIKNLNKVFKIPHEKRTTLIESIIKLHKRIKYEKLHALKNLNFSVKKGETIGVIGPNGSGKTTLLSIIADILKPTFGEVRVNGKIIPLLGLGIGFHPELTAKENIYLYGTLMGFEREEIDKKFNRIIKFSGLNKFIDTPLKDLSSGMQARLAFSIAIQSQGDIYLIDEVLAVGDLSFQKKCLDIIRKFQKAGKTMILVTQGLDLVNKLCYKALFLHNGKQIYFGKPEVAIKKYLRFSDIKNKNITKEIKKSIKKEIAIEEKNISKSPIGTTIKKMGGIRITNIKVLNEKGKEATEFRKNSNISIKISYNASRKIKNPYFGVAIHSKDGKILIGPNTNSDKCKIRALSGKGYILCKFKKLPLKEGEYYISASIHKKDEAEVFDFKNMVKKFIIVGDKNKGHGIVEVEHKWKIQS